MNLVHPWVAIVTVLSLLVYIAAAVAAGRARGKHKIAAPAIVGHPEYERALRVQMNTLEWLPIYLPGLWLFSAFADPRLAAAIGVIWIVGRVLYMTTYLKDPAKRGPGFMIQAAAALFLLIGGLVGAVVSLVNHGG